MTESGVAIAGSMAIARDKRSLALLAQNNLERNIRNGIYPPGSKLPSEDELARLMSVSRATIREALKTLESTGTIYRRRGVGTFVRQGASLHNPLDVNCGVTDLIRAADMEPGCSEMSVTFFSADTEVAEKLRIPRGADCLRLERVRTADGSPIVVSIDHLRAGTTLNRTLLDGGESLYEVLQAGGLAVDHGIAEVQVAPANAKLAAQLGVPRRTPLLVLRQVDYDADDVPVIYSIEWHVPGAFEIEIYRRGPQQKASS